MNTSVVSPGRAGLILLLTGQMLPMIDTSITNVALDAITHSLHATATELELIVALYGVAFAVCLALGSKLGDNFGRRRLFMWGVASFGLASLLCGMAGNIEQLLAARIVQGAGAALIVPQILATLHVTLKGTAHAKAISLFGGIDYTDRRNDFSLRARGFGQTVALPEQKALWCVRAQPRLCAPGPDLLPGGPPRAQGDDHALDARVQQVADVPPA